MPCGGRYGITKNSLFLQKYMIILKIHLLSAEIKHITNGLKLLKFIKKNILNAGKNLIKQLIVIIVT